MNVIESHKALMKFLRDFLSNPKSRLPIVLWLVVIILVVFCAAFIAQLGQSSAGKVFSSKTEVVIYKYLDRKGERKLIESLRAITEKAPISISCIMGNQESCEFAEYLKEKFLAAGWYVDGVNQSIVSANFVGINIMTRQAFSQQAQYLVDILKKINVVGKDSILMEKDEAYSIDVLIGSSK